MKEIYSHKESNYNVKQLWQHLGTFGRELPPLQSERKDRLSREEHRAIHEVSRITA